MAKVPMFVSSMLRQPHLRHALRNETRGAVLADSVEAAFDSRSRRRGLLGRDSVGDGRALIIAPCNSIHTFRMRFAIDVVFVRKNGDVVKVCRAVPAWRIRLAPRAFAVIELDAGALERAPVEIGDRLIVAEAASPTADEDARGRG